MLRFALVSSPQIDVERVRAFMPSNYDAWPLLLRGEQVAVVIVGTDNAGWTLDDYVLPRLASGMIYATELVTKGADDE